MPGGYQASLNMHRGYAILMSRKVADQIVMEAF